VTLNASAGLLQQGRKMSIASNAPLAGNAHIDIPALDWLAGLISPALITEGRLQSDLRIAGTLDDPRLSGQVAGDALRMFLTDLGVDLRQGQLAGSFTEDRFVLQRLRFAGGDGELLLSGPIRLAGGQPSGELKLQARRYPLLNASDRRVVLSGDSDVALAAPVLRVRGRLHVDQGRIDIGKSELPQLSDDVVIVGRQQGEGKPLGTDISLAIDLGEQLRLEGRGLKARLEGELTVGNRPGQALATEGTVRLVDGTFSAYTRELKIEEGVLRFTGAINNPALNILAMRRGQEVAAGVSVRGTMLSPRLTLVSEPNVPDSAKLSWLVLGQGISSATGPADAASMQAASGSLLSGSSVAGTPSTLSRSAEAQQQRVLSLGRQVSERLYLSVAQNLETTNPALRVRYALSPKLTAEVEAGTISFLSLFYNIAFY
jgi:translocation and assembly module TamB